jgi:hypothetical protein
MTNKLSIYKIKKLAKYITVELIRMEKETPNDGDLGQIVRLFIKDIFYRKNGKNGKNGKNRKSNSRGLLSDEVS